MGGSLKKLVVSATGEFGSGKSHDQLKKWVDANGGKWCPKVSQGITHLICSKENWKKQVDAVTTAQELGAQIVSYDWLEDSLMSKKKLAEKNYTWGVLSKERKDKKTMKRTAEKFDTLRFKQGSDQAYEDLGTGTSKSKPKPRSKTSASSTPRKAASRAPTSRTPTRPAQNGFFRSSIQDLTTKREEREAKDKAATQGIQLSHQADKEPGLAMEVDNVAEKTNEESGNESGEASVEEEMEGIQEGPVDLEQELQGGSSSSSSRPPPSPSPSSTPTPAPAPAPIPVKPKPTHAAAPDKTLLNHPLRNILKQTCSPQSAPIPSSSPPPSSAADFLKSPSSVPTTSAPVGVPKTERLADLFHLYQDNTGFEFAVTLVRSNLLTNSNARYVIRLYESNTTPHTYCTFIRYWPAGRSEWANKAHIPLFSKGGSLANKSTKTEINGVTGFEKQVQLSQNPDATAEQQAIDIHPSIASAISTITPPPPSANTPFRTLLTPQTADYATAFSAFRHAFQDLTLLSWSQRILPSSRTLQTQRAKALDTEPFIYTPPRQGLPLGSMPNPSLPLPQDSTYVRGALALPGMHAPLDKTGLIGSAIAREEEAKKRADEEMERKVKKEERERVKMRLGIPTKKKTGPGMKWDKRDYWTGREQYRSR
ncbi:hypothetical protein BDV96DRAFT_639212 [Lophiotrema nucula]|uniref:BRCT domain-containing protein n=1 Tax=Lophiotrema nucula TaxID=690887 RepID=A0A6A5ZV02_9PLEO|nr:hypothetical protein BDV96DRAFT_639212 [Lophiotrema nucula]